MLKKRNFLAFLLLIFTAFAYAKAIMNIAPTPLRNGVPVFLSSQGHSELLYTVTNNTNAQTLNQFTIYPTFSLTPNAATAVRLFSNTCISPLTPGASCNFTLSLTGNIYLTSPFLLSPRVCAYNDAVCSQPIAANRVFVYPNQNYTRAYISASTSRAVFRCDINDSGDFVNCVMQEPDTEGFVTTDLAFSVDQTTAFIIQDNNPGPSPNNLISCTVNIDGSLNPCIVNPTDVVQGAAPRSILINNTGARAYITNNYNGVPGVYTISKCDISNNILTNCTGTGYQDSGSYGIAFNSANTLAYITNLAADSVYVCNIDASNGNLINCTAELMTPTLESPTGIALNRSETQAYITRGDAGFDTVYLCDIGSNGHFTGTCSSTAITGANNPRGIFIDNIRNLVYISNLNGTQQVIKCTLNLSSCSVASQPFGMPIGMVLQ